MPAASRGKRIRLRLRPCGHVVGRSYSRGFASGVVAYSIGVPRRPTTAGRCSPPNSSAKSAACKSAPAGPSGPSSAAQYHSRLQGGRPLLRGSPRVPARRRRAHHRLERHRPRRHAVRQALRRGTRTDRPHRRRCQRQPPLRFAGRDEADGRRRDGGPDRLQRRGQQRPRRPRRLHRPGRALPAPRPSGPKHAAPAAPRRAVLRADPARHVPADGPRFSNRVHRRRAAVFLFSDFLDALATSRRSAWRRRGTT